MATNFTQDVSKMNAEQLRAYVAELQQAAITRTKITCKVSEKGALSIYGMGKWPVTLYMSQYDRLIAELPAIAKFVEEHRKLAFGEGGFATKA